MDLTHLNEKGEARMVDIGEKAPTRRRAVAVAYIDMHTETLSMITSGTAPKGDVFAAARIAGIMAAKKTPELIPLCHPVPIDSVEVELEPVSDTRIRITASASCHFGTGIEMEALTAVSAAALTVYDMCKTVDRGMVISEIHLVEKSGGRSGTFRFGEEES